MKQVGIGRKIWQKNGGQRPVENREKIRWLKRYKACGRLAEQLENDLARWRSIAERSSASIQPVPGGGGVQDTMPQMVENILELEEKLEKQRACCLRVRLEIERAIASVQQEQLQLVLRYLYVEGFSLEDVARKMGYSYAHTKRLHGVAVTMLKR